jgi:redox-sensing transcriptional repressor
MDAIPAPTIRRLSLYLRQLDECATRGVRTISSKQLGEKLNLSDAQVRKDLAHFGPFGHPGIGYRVQDLIPRIRQILGTDKTWPVVLVGCGNLGRALAAYKGFARKGFVLEAVFDNDPAVLGRELPGLEGIVVRPITELPQVASRVTPMLGILAVPADSAQAVAEQMIAAGIRGILNFAPVALRVPPDVRVAGVDLAVHLEQLSFQVGGMVPDGSFTQVG